MPGDGDNETPRQGIGNQDQGHPAAHGAFNSQFDDDKAENVEENCLTTRRQEEGCPMRAPIYFLNVNKLFPVIRLSRRQPTRYIL